ncbi:glycosyltransferase family 4 protein [Flavobacterium sp. NRK1]|uniref:glycosyltransferase family 4 protein n=1 Tax=Flavobacterium sp. NRK1 TaxID=2954929 RepID=UPI002093FB35|nr:glycosyltransferase family 4 protein [Flavobacterium sp. NRK1]MCO6147655.1 glycosyltransferase family 4 protein [Flavobacterium sp. NRK1]
MRKALINDWYYINGGAEKVIHSLNNIWDDFDHFALIDFLNESDRAFILKGKRAKTSFIQKLFTAKKNHRKYLQLFPYAIEQFDLSEYDLIISSSASVAKGVLTNHEQLHICYCHSPLRYAWDLYFRYLADSGLMSGLKGIYAKYVLHKIRLWDQLSSNRVDYFIANSYYVKKRIKKIYNREAKVIYPPVDTSFFSCNEKKEDYYFTASRMITYKKIEVIVEAFNRMPEKKLIVAGDGPEFKRIKKIAKSNIEIKGFIDRDQLKTYMQNAKAFVFAAEEDFGIVPVEAQACGTPVIAFGKGGTLETVKNGKTGVFFKEQSADSIKEAVDRFEKITFDYKQIREHSLQFSKERFETEMKNFVDEKWAEHINK